MGSAGDVRFALSTATHVPAGLHRRYSALRDESAKVRGGWVSVEGSPLGEFGVSSAACLAPVSQTAGVRCKSSPLVPPPRPMWTTAAALGLGAIVSCDSCAPSPWPPGGQVVGAGGRPAGP